MTLSYLLPYSHFRVTEPLTLSYSLPYSHFGVTESITLSYSLPYSHFGVTESMTLSYSEYSTPPDYMYVRMNNRKEPLLNL